MHKLRNERSWHFISGLPRSGSTLLAAILRQNPRFHADISSPLHGICGGLIQQVSAGREAATLVDQPMRKRLVRGLFEGFYGELNAPVVFDTNRGWSAEIGLLKDLFPAAKVIACVRSLAWIMDSLERLYQANPYEATRLFQHVGCRSTVYSRLEPLAQHDQLVGYAWSALRQAFYGEHADQLLIVDYEILVKEPGQTMRLIYQFIDEDYFDHDFSNLQFESSEFDRLLGVPSLHSVRSQVQWSERPSILPPDLIKKFSALDFWYDTRGSQAFVISPSRSQLRSG